MTAAATKAVCPHCGAVLDLDEDGAPVHPAPACETVTAKGGIRHESCYFWDIRAGECRYEMLFLGCEPCAACPG